MESINNTNSKTSISTNHDFIVCGADTDSIMFCKRDQTPFSEQEQDDLLEELNSLFPEDIKWEHDGIYNKVVYIKAKNYILYDGKKTKFKGSSLKATTIEPRIKEFIDEIIDAIIFDKGGYTEIYNRYVKEACNVTDIKPWSCRKTISERTLQSERTNELLIRDAIEGREIVEGDRVWVFYTNSGVVKLAEEFDGDYSVGRLLHKLHKASERFKTVLPVKELFTNYALARSKKALSELIGRTIDVNK